MSTKSSHFFAYLSRMKFIQRWGLMRNSSQENIQEHSLQVAIIAHGLATIKNELFGGNVNVDRAVTLAVFHDASEVITGDLPMPIKYFNPAIREEYAKIETFASNRLLDMLPQRLARLYKPLFFKEDSENELWKIVKNADKICTYLKCVDELKTGNIEFEKAEKSVRADIEKIEDPEVRYFIEHFLPSFSLTLDELN
jgi:5'-deoxynucleotidase